MQKHIKTLSAAVLLAMGVCYAVNVYAQSQIFVAPRLKWLRAASSYGLGVLDSTRISIPAPNGAATADNVDTTAWFDVGQFKFNQTYTGQPLVQFQLNGQLSTTTDSLSYVLQYSNDLTSTGKGSISASAASVVSVAASTGGVSTGDDGMYGTVVALAPVTTATAANTALAQNYRLVRLIITNIDASGATGRRYFSVTPIVYGWR